MRQTVCVFFGTVFKQALQIYATLPSDELKISLLFFMLCGIL